MDGKWHGQHGSKACWIEPLAYLSHYFQSKVLFILSEVVYCHH